MNAISVANVAIRQFDNLYSLNDLHKASGGEKRHELTNWLKLQQTTELIDELSKPDITGLKENQQVIKVVRGGSKRGTYACKELVYAYATWISAKFFLQVIRTFDAVISGSLHSSEALPSAQTTIDERRGLVDAVKLLVARCGIDYSAAYRMVHQRFGVAHIDQIAAPLLPAAVAYVHSLTLHHGLDGEVLDRLPADLQMQETVIDDETIISIADLLLQLQYMRRFIIRYIPAFQAFGIEATDVLQGYTGAPEQTYGKVLDFYANQVRRLMNTRHKAANAYLYGKILQVS